MDYLKARLQERSTAFGLGSLAIAAACLIFPEYATMIQMIAGAFGVGAAALPTGGRPQ